MGEDISNYINQKVKNITCLFFILTILALKKLLVYILMNPIWFSMLVLVGTIGTSFRQSGVYLDILSKLLIWLCLNKGITELF